MNIKSSAKASFIEELQLHNEIKQPERVQKTLSSFSSE